MPYSEYLRRRALVLHSRGLTARAIVDSGRRRPKRNPARNSEVSPSGPGYRDPGKAARERSTFFGNTTDTGPRGKPDAPRR